MISKALLMLNNDPEGAITPSIAMYDQYIKIYKHLPHHISCVYQFENGYGASIIRGKHTYGGDLGLFELAVVKFISDDDFMLCYDTPITEDVIGYLSLDELAPLLQQIKALPYTGITDY